MLKRKNMDFYYFSLCHVCKWPSPNLKKCSRCKVLYYCSRDHQLQDWPSHKSICKAITNVNKSYICPKNPNTDEYNHYKSTSSLLWRCELGRDLKYSEHQMWMFSKICKFCYSPEADIVCTTCLSVAYCTEQHENLHKPVHKRFCHDLKLCLLLNQITKKEGVVRDWSNFKVSQRVEYLPEHFGEVLRLIGIDYVSDYSKKHLTHVLISENFCPAVNILYALEKSGFIKKREGKHVKLTIHLVGPSHSENKLVWNIILEFIAKWILNLEEIVIFFIGPEVNNEELLTVTCKRGDCRIVNCTIIKVKGLYHNNVGLIQKPDLVVALNSGLHEYIDSTNDTWKNSVPELVRYKEVPLLLTAYTESELNRDLERFSSIRFLVQPQRNPYSSLRPNRNWEEGSELVYYEHGYFTVITKP